MSTSSLTRVIETGGFGYDYGSGPGRDSDRIGLALHRHSDGYLAGHGLELVKFLTGFERTCGVPRDRALNHVPKYAAGPRCLAAQLVAHFKKEVGAFYLAPSDEIPEDFDYVYDLFVNRSSLDYRLKIWVPYLDGAVLFDDAPELFNLTRANDRYAAARR